MFRGPLAYFSGGFFTLILRSEERYDEWHRRQPEGATKKAAL
jgi:hypothetical protein